MHVPVHPSVLVLLDVARTFAKCADSFLVSFQISCAAV